MKVDVTTEVEKVQMEEYPLFLNQKSDKSGIIELTKWKKLTAELIKKEKQKKV